MPGKISSDTHKIIIKSYLNHDMINPMEKCRASCENRLFAYAKTKTQISFAVTAKLISALVFAR